MRIPGWPLTSATAFKEASSHAFAQQCQCHRHAEASSSAVACRAPQAPATVLALATGTCPTCGFFNHPEATVRAADDGWTYCSNCGEMW